MQTLMRLKKRKNIRPVYTVYYYSCKINMHEDDMHR